jgi:WD40 repeat protein
VCKVLGIGFCFSILISLSSTWLRSQTNERTELVIQNVHRSVNFSVALSPDWKLMATGSARSDPVRLWRFTPTGLLLLHSFENRADNFAFSQDGRLLAICEFVQVVLWQVPTGPPLPRIEAPGCDALAFSPDGRILATAHRDGSVALWDVASGQFIRRLGSHKYGIRSLAFAPDGKVLVTGGDWSGDNLKVWNLADGQLVRTLAGRLGRSSVQSMAFSPDGKMLVAGGPGEFPTPPKAEIWDVASWTLVRSIETEGVSIISVNFSPSGKLLVIGPFGGAIGLWDVASGLQVRSFKGVFGKAFLSPDAAALVSVATTIDMWDTAANGSLKSRRSLAGRVDDVESATIDQRGNLVASIAGSTIHLWDLKTGRHIASLKGSSTGGYPVVRFSPDGSVLAVSEFQSIRLWSVNERRQITQLSSGSGGSDDSGFGPLVFSPDGTLVASANATSIKIWQVGSRRLVRSINMTDKGYCSSLDFSSDGKLLASSAKNSLMIWDVGSGELLRSMKTTHEFVEAIALSPDGTAIAAASTNLSSAQIQVWKTNGDSLFSLVGHEHRVMALAFSHDGGRIATGGQDGTVKIWERATGRLIRTLGTSTELAPWVTSLAFGPDGKRIVSGTTGHEDTNGAISVWSTATGELLATLVAFSDDNWVSYTQNGYFTGSQGVAQFAVWKIHGLVYPFSKFGGSRDKPAVVAKSLSKP